MKIKEIFRIGGITELIDGRSPFLDWNNCSIENKSMSENSLILRLKRKSDGEEGISRLRVQDKFKSIENQLLNWAFASSKIVGLTLNDLNDLDVDIEIQDFKGRLSIKNN